MTKTDNTLRVSKIVVVESLPEGDRRTGKLLHQDLSLILINEQHIVRSEYVQCDSPIEFAAIVARLTHEVKVAGEAPVLHVEAHGGRSLGLQFANGEYLGWAEFNDVLRPLNAATELNLVTVVAACYGMDAVITHSLKRAAPCYGLIAPDEEVIPDELYAGFIAFYSALLTTLDFGVAISVLKAKRLHRGFWQTVRAEWWFKELMTQYFREQTGRASRHRLARKHYRSLKKQGIATRIGRLKRELAKNMPTVARNYFRAFFLLDTVPSNAERFATVWAAVNQEMKASLKM